MGEVQEGSEESYRIIWHRKLRSNVFLRRKKGTLDSSTASFPSQRKEAEEGEMPRTCIITRSLPNQLATGHENHLVLLDPGT
jgi:hypothetical protein